MKWTAVVVMIVVAAVLGLVLFQAQGAPSQPGVALSGTLTPSTAQTVQFTFTNTLYSVQPPNSIVDLGTAVVYSIVANNITDLAFHDKAATSVVAVSGSVYTVSITVSVSVPQLCTGAACGGFVENLTVTAYATTATYVGFWTSHVVQVSFFSGGAPTRVTEGAFDGQVVTSSSVSSGAADPSTFYYETFGMVTVFGAILFLVGAFGMGKADIAFIGTVVLIAVFVFEYVSWVVLR